MDSAAYVFPAVRGTQAQREYYISMVPLDVMSKIFQFADEDLPPEIRAQRILNKSRIPEIRDYILSNPDSYVFSALTVSVDGNMEFMPADEMMPQVGAISISMTSRFLINDGQHRRAAIAEAIKMNPSLKNEHISVVFYRDEGLLRSQQMFSDLNLHQQILERLINCGLSQTDLRAVQDIINEVLVGHIPESATKETIKNMSATSMMLYQRLIAEVFQSFTQRINSLVNHVDAQESELMSLDAHLGAADEKTLAMQLFDALKSVEGEKTLADAEYQRQLDSIESLKRQREMLVAKRIQLIKAIAEKEQANDDNARIVKYAAMSIEVLREFKVRLQREKVAKLSSTATKCFRELVEKDSLVSEIKIDPTTLDVTILDLDGNELLKSQLSAGEQQMFAVAIVWALALTSGYKAPVIIDTPMARLDSSHRANFVTKYLPAASSQVMVLSTDEEVYGRYLDLVRDNVVDYYTLLYREEEQCTSIVHGYFGEV